MLKKNEVGNLKFLKLLKNLKFALELLIAKWKYVSFPVM